MISGKLNCLCQIWLICKCRDHCYLSHKVILEIKWVNTCNKVFGKLPQQAFSICSYLLLWGFLWWLSGKEPACKCRSRGFNLWVMKIPLEKERKPLQYSCLGNPMDTEAWGLKSMGLQRVGHDSGTEYACTLLQWFTKRIQICTGKEG